MSANQQQIDLIINWSIKIIVGVSAFLIVMFVNEMRSDVKTVLLEQKVMQEKVRRIERVIDKMEDKALADS